MNKNENTSNQETIQRLKSAGSLYVLMSGCTQEPYVSCDPETYDDEVMMFFDPKEAKERAKAFLEDNIPVNVARLEQRQMLMFYTSLYTMGVNALVVGDGESRHRIQLADFVRRDLPKKQPGSGPWAENPSLHLTALYYMQELRRQPGREEDPQMKEWRDEISNYFSKGSFIVAVQKEGEGIPIVKLNDKEFYQAIFTDIIEFQKFNNKDQLRPVIVTADKIPQILVAEASGVLLNPMGVRMPLQVKKQDGGAE